MDVQEKTKEQWLSQGIAYLKQQQLEKALVACLYARQIDPLCARAYHGIALIFEQLNLYTDARASYEKALELAPDNAKVNYDMANFLYLREEYKKAGEYYRKARQLDPQYKDYYHSKISSCENHEIAIELASDDPEAIRWVADLLHRHGNSTMSGKYYQKARQLDPQYNPYPQYNPSPQYNPYKDDGEVKKEAPGVIHFFTCRCPECVNYN